MQVEVTPKARRELAALPLPMMNRVQNVLVRLSAWPKVSGVKALRGNLKGDYRVRTGDWRLLFRVKGDRIVVWRVDNRRDVYEK